MTQQTIAVAPNRHIGLNALIATLREQHTRSVDVIAGASTMRSDEGTLVIPRTAPVLTSTGVDLTAGQFRLSQVALGGVGAKLDIPVPYLRRLARENVPLLDDNINSWLERDDRRFLVRCQRDTPDSNDGTARAFLSDRYLRIDNLDVLMAAIKGIEKARVGVQIASCDLTDRRMYVRFVSPEVQVMAPELLRHYRSPFDGRRGSDLPVISGGFLLKNSETGYGRYSLAPWLRIEVCTNGQTVEHGTVGRTHVGARITDQDGIVDPSAETIRRALALITAQTVDTIRAYLNVDFVARAVSDLERAAGVKVRRPEVTIKVVSQQLHYTQDQQDAILAHFIAGSDLSAGGVMQAVTSVARSIEDADAAYRMETTASRALRLAAAAA
ncbi:DUF932 domain-containing protein [Actinoplanes sp. LDG1-06]|uniref:DUF932 domain-containing protein n=1 Tax=Paractinoplanes ovalisporus TaxID=2810368 RepID=A0ABS2AU57_9ACTN|nr:DUF932 domain-containing protein [Actinoplanes ovalisporus]MBM2623413.1 DUF932 domain-containing protein [Actinoplanes ovalisporus]